MIATFLFHIFIVCHHISPFCHLHHHKLMCVDPGGPNA